MTRLFLTLVCSLALVLLWTAIPILGQSRGGAPSASVKGRVCDADGHPLAGATVALQNGQKIPISIATDARGDFHFASLAPGNYSLNAVFRDFAELRYGPFSLGEGEEKSVSLQMKKVGASETKSPTSEIPFSEDTHFTVAGVTDTTSLGGHGSDRVRRNTDALSKEAVSLANPGASDLGEAEIRTRLANEENASLRFQLAEIEEKNGRSLDAVKDYQRAAEVDPSEPHLFAWGAELLLHRAFEPAAEVFGKGAKRYPRSTRMVLGLGSATYAQGKSDVAKTIFLRACDIDPADPTPYLFLGRIQATETNLPEGWADRLKRFTELDPKNAMVHYLYAVALTKQTQDNMQIALAESQLKTAISLDPKLGDAYLELGILVSQQGDLPSAVPYLQKAVENTPLPDEAHYRLAQVYRRMGESEKAQRETALYKQVAEQKNQQVERERRELQQFVYTLREQPAPAQNPPTEK